LVEVGVTSRRTDETAMGARTEEYWETIYRSKAKRRRERDKYVEQEVRAAREMGGRER